MTKNRISRPRLSARLYLDLYSVREKRWAAKSGRYRVHGERTELSEGAADMGWGGGRGHREVEGGGGGGG